MPVTDNVAWDGRLKSFKGRDTPHYVATAAAIAAQCTFCGRPLEPGQLLSLSVDITESTAPDGTEYLTFSDYVSHRKCKEPELTVRRAAWRPTALTPLAARVILTQEPTGPGPGTVVPALAYTLVPVLTFREAGGELTSALVSLLLTHGFELAMSPGLTQILAQASEVGEGCALTITDAGLVTITVGGETIYMEQLSSMKPDDAEWLEAASNGSVLIIAGDNLVITDTKFGLETAARLGTLVIGYVPVRS